MRFQFTIRDLLWLLVVIALVLAWRIDRSRVPQWEYTSETINNSSDAELDKLGAEGWEVCAVTGNDGFHRSLVLKRPKR